VVLEKEAQSLVDRLKELRDGIDIDTTLLAAIDEVSCLKLFFIDI